ncbi:Flp pilus assembly protein CpaB [Gordonibacter sp.]|uniref:Flp pilus assembly protein CpaB n=1 Tax=Gordonibacter sp. TaxID=1968902 RepID=UPI002FC909E5
MIMQQRRGSGASSGYASRETVDQIASDSEGAGPRRVRADVGQAVREPRDSQNPRRIKRLAAVAATSVAVALVSAAYGTWAALSAQAAVEASQADAQPTLVAKSDIQAGEELKSSSLEVRMVPRSLRIASALPGEVPAEGESVVGKRALVALPAGSQLTPLTVAGATGGDRLAASLGAGMQAVTVGVDAESGLAGQLRPSDRVRVVALEGSASNETYLATICDSARIMSLDAGQSGGSGGYASVTLEVTPSQADAVRTAQYAGKVSFVLVSVLDDPLVQADPHLGESASGEEDVDG